MAKQKQQRDESGNPFKPGGDDPGHAPESGEPTEMGVSHGKAIERGDSAASRKRTQGTKSSNRGSGRRGKK